MVGKSFKLQAEGLHKKLELFATSSAPTSTMKEKLLARMLWFSDIRHILYRRLKE